MYDGDPKTAPTSPSWAERAAHGEGDRDDDLDEQRAGLPVPLPRRLHARPALPRFLLVAAPTYAMTKRNITTTAPAYTSTCAAATNSALSSRYMTASEARFPISASAEKNGFRNEITATAEGEAREARREPHDPDEQHSRREKATTGVTIFALHV